jgi:hypothetical protein
MKKSELQQIIKEEIQNILNEEETEKFEYTFRYIYSERSPGGDWDRNPGQVTVTAKDRKESEDLAYEKAKKFPNSFGPVSRSSFKLKATTDPNASLDI